MFEAYEGDERVRVVAVATAFEKEQYPWMADEEKIKDRLKQEGLEFPVMRDKDEQTVKIVGLGSRYGTPLTIVLDADGIVRWHGFNANEESAGEIDEVIEKLLESFFVASIPDLHVRLRDYEKGKYANAYKTAQKLLEAEDTPDELRAHAELVVKNIDEAVGRQIAQAEAKRARGTPGAALAGLEMSAKAFKGTVRWKELDDAFRALKADAGFKKELKAEKDLEKALEKLAKNPEKATKSVKAKLEKLLEQCAGSPVARRVEEALKSLE